MNYFINKQKKVLNSVSQIMGCQDLAYILTMGTTSVSELTTI